MRLFPAESALRTLVAPYKIPKHIEFPATLPRTTSGKILHRNLRDRMTQQVMADYRIRH